MGWWGGKRRKLWIALKFFLFAFFFLFALFFSFWKSQIKWRHLMLKNKTWWQEYCRGFTEIIKSFKIIVSLSFSINAVKDNHAEESLRKHVHYFQTLSTVSNYISKHMKCAKCLFLLKCVQATFSYVIFWRKKPPLKWLFFLFFS